MTSRFNCPKQSRLNRPEDNALLRPANARLQSFQVARHLVGHHDLGLGEPAAAPQHLHVLSHVFEDPRVGRDAEASVAAARDERDATVPDILHDVVQSALPREEHCAGGITEEGLKRPVVVGGDLGAAGSYCLGLKKSLLAQQQQL